MYKIVIFVGLSMLAFGAISDQRCDTWGCVSTIENIYTRANGDIYIGTPFDEKKANCTPVSDVYFTLNRTSENFSQIYSTILAAYMAGLPIQLRVSENSERCAIAYTNLHVDH